LFVSLEGLPNVIAGQADMLPRERSDVGQLFFREIVSFGTQPIDGP
jgi:hypothetical protein